LNLLNARLDAAGQLPQRSALAAIGAVLYLLLVLCLLAYVAACRAPDLTDEGLYIYDAWAAYGAAGPVPQSFVPYSHQGYFLGLPYLFFEHPGVFGLRLHSFLMWMGAYALLLWAYARRLRQTWLTPWLCGFFPYSMFVASLSYQTLPFVILSAAGGLLLLAAEETNSRLQRFAAFSCPCLVLSAALSYLPSIPTVVVALLTALLCMRDSSRRRRFLCGTAAGVIVVAGIVWLEQVNSAHSIVRVHPTDAGALWQRFQNWCSATTRFALAPLLTGLAGVLQLWLVVWGKRRRNFWSKHPLTRSGLCDEAIVFSSRSRGR